MKLDVRALAPGQRIPFAYWLDLSDLEFAGRRPAARPVAAEGHIQNHAGALLFRATLQTELALRCDRCDRPFDRDMTVRVETTLADAVEDEGSLGIDLLDGGFCDADKILVPAFILEMDIKHLCREDCAGLCFFCGQDLNEGSCSCGPTAGSDAGC